MVIIIVLNLIFGVIIDTFADLRSEKQKKEEILKTTCFICGEEIYIHFQSLLQINQYSNHCLGYIFPTEAFLPAQHIRQH